MDSPGFPEHGSGGEPWLPSFRFVMRRKKGEVLSLLLLVVVLLLMSMCSHRAIVTKNDTPDRVLLYFLYFRDTCCSEL